MAGCVDEAFAVVLTVNFTFSLFCQYNPLDQLFPYLWLLVAGLGLYFVRAISRSQCVFESESFDNIILGIVLGYIPFFFFPKN